MPKIKTLKYFGANYCPHSNKTSRAFLIITSLKQKYPDINLEIYMSEEVNHEGKNEFVKANAEYVPTITNSSYSKINLSLPDNYNLEDKTDEELMNNLLDHIYNQLDDNEVFDEEIDNKNNSLFNFDNKTIKLVKTIIIAIIFIIILCICGIK